PQTSAKPTSSVPAPGTVAVTPVALQDTNTPPAWQILPGMQIFVDTYNTSPGNTQQEVVTVSSVDTVAGTFTANFAYPHAAGFPIFVPLASTTSQNSVYGSGAYTINVNNTTPPLTTTSNSISGSLPTTPGTAGAPAWTIQPGSIISVDSGANQETVQVTAVNG